MTITIHSKEDFKKMRIAGKLAAETLDFITDYVKPGVTTNELNDSLSVTNRVFGRSSRRGR